MKLRGFTWKMCAKALGYGPGLRPSSSCSVFIYSDWQGLGFFYDFSCNLIPGNRGDGIKPPMPVKKMRYMDPWPSLITYNYSNIIEPAVWKCRAWSIVKCLCDLHVSKWGTCSLFSHKPLQATAGVVLRKLRMPEFHRTASWIKIYCSRLPFLSLHNEIRLCN